MKKPCGSSLLSDFQLGKNSHNFISAMNGDLPPAAPPGIKLRTVSTGLRAARSPLYQHPLLV
jgi:hypothetical protein